LDFLKRKAFVAWQFSPMKACSMMFVNQSMPMLQWITKGIDVYKELVWIEISVSITCSL